LRQRAAPPAGAISTDHWHGGAELGMARPLGRYAGLTGTSPRLNLRRTSARSTSACSHAEPSGTA
jgi:hypothetical protein